MNNYKETMRNMIEILIVETKKQKYFRNKSKILWLLNMMKSFL
jgi:hypothetical protein